MFLFLAPTATTIAGDQATYMSYGNVLVQLLRLLQLLPPPHMRNGNGSPDWKATQPLQPGHLTPFPFTASPLHHLFDPPPPCHSRCSASGALCGKYALWAPDNGNNNDCSMLITSWGRRFVPNFALWEPKTGNPRYPRLRPPCIFQLRQ